MDILELKKQANEIRKGIVTAVHSAKSGHPGGSLSAADIFTYLYFEEMNIDPKDPKKQDRDRFVLSKGHVAPALYSTLAHRGYFPVSDLTTLRKVGSYLQGHPDMKGTKGVDMSSGSLGQGISVAAGMALSAKMSNEPHPIPERLCRSAFRGCDCFAVTLPLSCFKKDADYLMIHAAVLCRKSLRITSRILHNPDHLQKSP